MSGRGRLIILEGGEGAGKSTAARYIAQTLEARGRRAVLTREPGGSPLAEAIRGVVLGPWAGQMTAQTELLLMFAARAAHLHGTILPALRSGADVVCDRFVDSSYAYQGGGEGLPIAQIEALEGLVLGGLRPDLTLVFDIDPAIGLARTQRRGERNRFEDHDAAYMRRVRETFLRRTQADPRRYAVIDAGRSLDQVQAELSRLIGERL